VTGHGERESLRPGPDRADPGAPGPGGSSPGLDLLLALGPLLAISGSAVVLLDLPIQYLMVVTGLHLGMAALLLRGGRSGMPGPGLGAANRVTLGRALLVLPVAAMVPWGTSLDTPAIWWVIGASTLALSLDGVDGWVARSTGTSTPLGARFDMELDAFLLLALSLLLWLAGPLGPWVILIGALRYLFVAAGWLWPALQGALPESMRRKTVCVVQGVGLLVALGPIIPSPMAAAVAATALAALVYSFAVDVAWLARQARESPA
jgi:phosphatidylglycerophosphate synthase